MQDSVRLVQGNQRVQLRMHPADIELLGTTLDDLLAEIRSRSEIELVSDPTLERHGMTLRAADLRIDQQLSAQLERLREELQ